MKRVAIFTSFVGEIDTAYSLCGVVGNQLKMLIRYGYRPTFISRGIQNLKGIWAHPSITHKTTPNVILDTVTGVVPNMEEYRKNVDEMSKVLYEFLKDHDVCITHDAIFQKGELIHNAAARRVAEQLPKLRWLHWIHSGPEAHQKVDPPFNLRYKKFPNSFIVYPNTFDAGRVAAMYQIEETDVKLCYHPIDICEYLGFSQDTTKFIEDKNILDADIIAVYPIRLDRGKQPNKLISIFSHLKKMGRNVKLIIMDFHSTGGDKALFREDLKKQITREGLTNNEVIFLSEYDKKYNYHAPQSMVRELLQISNIFIQASTTETYSLIAQEAAICKNLLVLNDDFPPMRSIYGSDALYRKFSSVLITTKFNDENAGFHDMARYIDFYLSYDKSLALHTMLRKTRNLDYIMKNQFEKLLYAEG